VVLLDFHVFATRNSTQRIMQLRGLYNKYHAQGLEIYQVSLDENEHFWKTQTANLPWISVRDESGNSANLYNVQSIPTFFLITKDNVLYKRDVQIKDLDAEIKSLL
jgi:alkyl hydroperoxide reductase subunit AhpC